MTAATPPIRRTFAVLVAGAALAACATSQESDPGTTLTSTTSTSSTSTTSTTIAATTTEAPATTAAETTTTAAPTTEAPASTLPPGPTGDVFALYLGDSSGALTPLGTWDGGDWAAASDDEALPDAGREFTISRLSGAVDGTVDGSVEVCFDGRIGPTVSPDAGPAVPPEAGYNGVALPPPGWSLQPRRVADLDDDIPGYQELGEAAFDSADVDAAAGAIEQLVVADLDGDGNTEALVVFERVQEAESGTPEATLGSPGDFSGVLLVDTASRASTTVLSSVVLADDDEISIEFLEQYRILDVADYNGDGRMEIAVSAWYYEGAGVAVFAFDDGELNEVLATGCGA
ncbi:MAG: hypothetical protein AAGA42_18565 [Actinomycetota bacterium]